MKHELPLPRKRATNVSLPVEAVDEAKALGVNISRACEAGLLTEVKKERERQWRAEYREAIAANNAWVEKNGLPLADLRVL